jgi:hypothetical protein
MRQAAPVLSEDVTPGLIVLAAALVVATVDRRLRAIWPAMQGLAPASEVTAGLRPNSIWFVISRTATTLTKRRAVDFCHVATAICPRSPRP